MERIKKIMKDRWKKGRNTQESEERKNGGNKKRGRNKKEQKKEETHKRGLRMKDRALENNRAHLYSRCHNGEQCLHTCGLCIKKTKKKKIK